MKLQKIRLDGFRNIDAVEIGFSERFNIFFGNNAQGKTNLLESIYLLGTVKSFRHARNHDLIRWDTPQGMLQGWVVKDGVTRQITVLLDRQGKKVRVDNKSVVKIADFFGSLNVVVFSPEELAMAKGMPDGRRRFLDRAIFSGDAAYLHLYHQYHLILRNRNVLLKTGDRDNLPVWSQKLAEAGARLIARRVEYLEEITPLLVGFYGEISGSEEAGLRYLPHLAEGDGTVNGWQELLTEALLQRSGEEMRRGTTLSGPHRDDLEFLLDGRSLKRYGSQGQQRSFILALKMAEIEYLQRTFGSPPILLLDDMTSELDRHRNANLMAFLARKRMQVFITTTSLENLTLPATEPCTTFRIEEGRVLCAH